ncbi:sigma 54-interacting transcriptional regulator [Bacillus sp. FJAT-29790]|uniref:sigma-54 interaction domain-containing protein n=1 Tax=Bacillus sp. FJAT-29790 TaxID=1895002 RepID=UPI001C216809|nr:sigma 54-interacting transcriptional regulator [Bacillus sp. FJAT-29790]MBU8877524.1 sigma 54-interacting transcriptional regulator [Bacillus sp. FJAT-29790]
MNIRDYFIRDAICVQWPATFQQILMEAVKSNYNWFVLCSNQEIVGCIRREAFYEKLKEIDLTKIHMVSIDSLTTDVSVLYKEDSIQPLYQDNKIIVIKNKNDEVQGVIDWESDGNIHDLTSNDEWFMKEMQTIFEQYYESVFVTDKTGKVIRVTSNDDQQHLGENVFDLEKKKIFYPSITAKVLRSGKRENGLQYTNTGEIFDIESIPIKNNEGEVVRVVSITKDSSEINDLNQKLKESINLIENYQREVARFHQEKYEEKQFIYKSKKMEKLYELIRSVSSVDASVLILGETGVGKQVIANQIHLKSNRNDKPFITVNCGAIPENLLESELFGYEEGAFSGSRKGGKLGIFELADKGTLFLDEIGELPLSLQVKLLRALQERVIMRVGGTKEKKVDVRIITATNKDLNQMVKDGAFREDLYYRINVVPIQIPSLRDRKEDIEKLAFHFLAIFNQKYRKNIILNPAHLQKLLAYSWPGNVRELENTIERFVVMEKSIFFDEKETGSLQMTPIEVDDQHLPNLLEYMERVEKELLLRVMSRHHTTREMAQSLGVNQSTIVRKLQKHGLERNMLNKVIR